jgi:hypothetical protein
MKTRMSVATLGLAILLVSGCSGNASPEPSKAGQASPSPATEPSPPVRSASPSPLISTITLQPAADTVLDSATVGSLVPTPAGFVLLGSEARDGSTPPFVVAGTADGRSWTALRAASSEPMFSEMAGGPLGWVASTDQATGPGSGTTLWFSSDGVTWEPLADQAGLAAASLEGLGSGAPISAGPFGFAITGLSTIAGDSVSEVWVSRDGRTWTTAGELEGKHVNQVLSLPSGFLALGGDCCVGTSVAEFTTDGRSWRDLTAEPGSPFGPDSGPVLVTSVGSTIVVLRLGATGAIEVFSGEAGEASVAWRHSGSADAAFTHTTASTVTSTDGSALVLGFDRTTLAPISWTSHDGQSWRRTDLEPATFGGGVPGLAAGSGSAGGSSFVALGFRTNRAGGVRSQVWRSDDGTTWSAAGGDVLGVLPAAATGPCPATAPTAVEGFLAMDPTLWPVCFGAQTIKVTGYITNCGCGGTTSQTSIPTWLIDPLGFSDFYLAPPVVPADTGGGGFGVMIDPAHPVTVPPQEGTHVEATGHFDDPAAATCRVFPVPGAFGPVAPRMQTVAICERAFVATSVRALRS